MMFDIFKARKKVEPTISMQRAITKFRKNQQEGVRPDLLGAVYHGGCLGCPHLAGNDTHDGIEWCLGCSYSNFNESLPDLSR